LRNGSIFIGLFRLRFRLIATEDPMFGEHDFSEQPKIHTSACCRYAGCRILQELKANDPAVHAMTDFTSKFAITVVPTVKSMRPGRYGKVERARHAGGAGRLRHWPHHLYDIEGRERRDSPSGFR